jgi:hypothetical protein
MVLPPYLARAAEVDRTFYAHASCRTVLDTPKLAWTAEVKRKYKLNNQEYAGNVLIKMALEVCRHCPVQWECTAAAIEGEEPVGTWGDRIENVNWLGRQKNHDLHIIQAAEDGEPIQTMIKRLRHGT